jgi:hypothetical protein
MPWSTSDRAIRLPPDWHARRARTYRAAQGRCQALQDGQRCNTFAPLHKRGDQPAGHADHINPALGEDGPLQWLCPPHHSRKSSHEGHQAMAAQRCKARHPTEQHPAAR